MAACGAGSSLAAGWRVVAWAAEFSLAAGLGLGKALVLDLVTGPGC